MYVSFKVSIRSSRRDAIEKIKLGTRRYAKRQLTWLRRNPEINWLYPDRLGDFQSLVGEAEKIIGK